MNRTDARLRALEGHELRAWEPPTIIHRIIEPDGSCSKILINAPTPCARREAIEQMSPEERALVEGGQSV